MLFRINDKKEEVLRCNIEEDNFYIGIMLFEDFENIYKAFSIDDSSIEICRNRKVKNCNSVFFHNSYLYGYIELLKDTNIFSKKDSFAFFVFKNIFLIIVLEETNHYIFNVFDEVYKKIDEKNVSLVKVIYLFFNTLISNDYQYIEKLQEDIEELDKYNSREYSMIFVNKLKTINKELMMFRNYYENLVSIGEEMLIDYYHFFVKEDMIYMQIYVQRVTRLSDNISLLQELASQNREAHQSQLDYAMNRTMEFFTVVTSIFMPLTLMTGWYGMNFKVMPEIGYKYSYYIFIIVSIIIVGIFIYWFKKKKYL